MMTSLLSIFDPCSSTPFNNWISIILLVMAPVTLHFWLTYSWAQILFQKVMNGVNGMVGSSSKTNLFFVSMFMYFLVINITGLLPFGFSLSSHFSFNFSVAMVIWLSSMIWGFKNHPVHNLAHLTPLGCPQGLVPFMVLVEMISSLIRPITLSLRLMSNMLAGHMILALLSGGVLSIGAPFFLLEMFFLVFEFGVAFIQTYVFCSLSMLYWEETEFN